MRCRGVLAAGAATAQLAQEIGRVRRVAGVERIVLVAHSRAGNLVRNYLRLSGLTWPLSQGHVTVIEWGE